jgi:phosphoribosylaminoimidazolecarboxamide formyltransferase/IMP cyclohydrolase
MIRSAAKNWEAVAVVVKPTQYDAVVEELKNNRGSLSLQTRSELAREAFEQTSHYDALVSAYLGGAFASNGTSSHFTQTEYFAFGPHFRGGELGIETFHGKIPISAEWTISKTADLRYGENPHQQAGLYRTSECFGIAAAEQLSGKEMSFNNYVDADAAWQLVSDFEELSCAIIKHTNPAGVGTGATTEEAYRKALATDPVSAFGGIVAFNRRVDEAAARAVTEVFTEVVVAPDYEPAAIQILAAKKNLRILRAAAIPAGDRLEYRQISGGMLVQTADIHQLKRDELKIVSQRQPTVEEIRALLFAWTVCKHTKSNAIVYAHDGQTVGVGAGQMSRVDSVKIGAMRAQLPLKGSVLASDAFFPFRDGIDEAAKYGITAVIQPGGSVRDNEVIAAANEHGLAMVVTGIRHFKH